MKTLCYSVRLKEFNRISDKAFKALAYDGSTDIIPSSQIFGYDDSAQKSEAVWISAWILGKKSIQYSKKKKGWFDETGKQYPNFKIEKHVPTKIEEVENNDITELER